MNNNTVELWDKTYAGRTHWRGWPYERALAELPADFVPASVLDVGCGLGDGLLQCQERWPNAFLIGLDFSPVGLATAQKRLPAARFDCLDLNGALPTRVAAEIKSDLVLCCETLEHVEDPVAVEAMLVFLARRRVVVTVPNEGRVTSHHPNSFYRAWFEARKYRTVLRPHPVNKDDFIIVATLEVGP